MDEKLLNQYLNENNTNSTKSIRIRRIKVSSSNVNSIGYDKDSSTLDVEFKGGAVYRYSGVPEDVYIGLRNAPSKGSYLAKYIKSGGYPYEMISKPRK